ncbi:hypothetical protein AAMO2058_000504900, partial [Amorphochlora amoebiformis]
MDCWSTRKPKKSTRKSTTTSPTISSRAINARPTSPTQSLRNLGSHFPMEKRLRSLRQLEKRIRSNVRCRELLIQRYNAMVQDIEREKLEAETQET